MSILVREEWELRDEGQHRDDERRCLTGTCAVIANVNRLEEIELEVKGGRRTCLSDTNDIPILQSDRNGLTLDGRRLLVSDLFNDLEYLWRDGGLRP